MRIIKKFFLILVVVIVAIDIYGIWKYKFKETKYVSSEPDQDSSQVEEEVITLPPEPEIEYAELSREDYRQNEKLFITDIDLIEDEEQCEIKGLIYEEYEISVDDYTEIKNNGGSIEIFGRLYMMDQMKSYNLMLQPVEDDLDAEQFYIKYDYTNQKYLLKDATTDYTVYVPTEQYVRTVVDASVPFEIQKNNKTEKYTVADVAETHTKIPTQEGMVKIDYSTLEFSRSGEIIKITELKN